MLQVVKHSNTTAMDAVLGITGYRIDTFESTTLLSALFIAAVVNRTGLTSTMFHEMETPQIALDPDCTTCTEREPKELGCAESQAR
jgi:hypothetical protein